MRSGQRVTRPRQRVACLRASLESSSRRPKRPSPRLKWLHRRRNDSTGRRQTAIARHSRSRRRVKRSRRRANDFTTAAQVPSRRRKHSSERSESPVRRPRHVNRRPTSSSRSSRHTSRRSKSPSRGQVLLCRSLEGSSPPPESSSRHSMRLSGRLEPSTRQAWHSLPRRQSSVQRRHRLARPPAQGSRRPANAGTLRCGSRHRRVPQNVHDPVVRRHALELRVGVQHHAMAQDRRGHRFHVVGRYE